MYKKAKALEHNYHALIPKIPSGCLENIILVINVFHRGTYGSPSGSNRTRGVQLLLDGVHTKVSKEIYSNLCFPKGGPDPLSPSGSARV